ncbi:MAG: transporter substrate-binding domain-containing protein [Acidobacteriota bacterium]|nr:transporter substrate-binding domain-containing protein [Acidobacteriota bacterium]
MKKNTSRQFGSTAAVVLALLAPAVWLSGCGTSEPEEVPSAVPDGTVDDWPAILERGVIRFVRHGFEAFDTLPSQGLSKERYRFLAEQFAERHGLRPEWVVSPDVDGLLVALEEGRADVAVATLTVTETRQQRVAFTVPLTISREWVIGTGEGVFGVPAGTSYEESLAAHYPEAPRAPVAGVFDPLNIRTLIEDGAFDTTIMDEAAARVVVRTSPGIRKLAELPEARRIAWAVRRGNPELRDALDDFLTEHHTVADEPSEFRDWEAIRASGQLRLLTISSPVTHYLWRGERLGFEYELVKQFADSHGLDLAVIVARDHPELVEGLLTGRGDLVAAGWVQTPARAAEGLLFSRHYLEIQETFVTAGDPLADLTDLAGRTVTVPEATSYLATLGGLEGDFEVAESELSSHAILEAVAEGEIDVTLVDSHRAELAALFEPRLTLGLALDPTVQLVWAVGPLRADLKSELDAFLDAGYRGLEFNSLYNKYFVNRRRQARQREHRVTGDELSRYDALVKPAAEAEDFDWRLIVAQMYQESGFDPDTVSFAGARGLMQVMPRTAEELGVDPAELAVPEVGIDAGVRYLAWVRERFPDLPPGEQLWFALAAYNAGPGHVRDGRRLARQLGLDGSLWFGHVEEAMNRLSDPEYASRAAYGYVRGSEVTRYVRNIRDRYRGYVDHFVQLDEADR